ncbi:hypothetical protein N869_01865, partial [Cellulomonas bogoriensis 69B4 = DSM 16987]
MNQAHTEDLGIGQYLQVLARRWPVVAVTVVVVTALTVAYVVLAPRTATATTEVNLNVISTDPFTASRSASGLVDGTTEAQIASSYAVAVLASERLGDGTSSSELRRNVEVTPVADATVIRIAYTAPTPVAAQRGADMVAATYLEFRAEQAEQRLESMIARLEARLVSLREQLVAANARIASSREGSSTANQAVSDRDLVTIEIDSLLAQKSDLERIDTSGGAVLTPALENPVVHAPGTRMVLATGVLLGVVLGAVLAFPADRRNRRLRRGGDVAAVVDAPVLATLEGTEIVPLLEGVDRERMRAAREALLARLPDGGRVLAVLDRTATGAPDVAVGLALALAQDNRRVRLVLPDGDRDEVRDATSGLDLEQVAGGAMEVSRLVRGLEVVRAPAGGPCDADALITREVRDHVRGPGSAATVVLVVPHAAGAAS